jgi:large subunit ribosomal protein L3
MKFILGKKIGMTRVFDENGKATSVTLVEAEPCTVVCIRTNEKDTYEAIQIGCGHKKKINKPEIGHSGQHGAFSVLKEFRTKSSSYKVGDKIDVTIFNEGDAVNISGISKSKGFQGVVKRHGFAGGPASHGQKHSLREPGSIGSGGVQRVFKGMKMAGRMGGERKFVSGLKIVKIEKEDNIIAISGAIPGRRGTLIEIKGK